jgi:uncharacterized protein (TIGR03083 family)
VSSVAPRPLGPYYVADLFRPLLGELIALLRGLHADDWQRPTVAGSWRVRDVAAHLLDGDIRKISAQRDGHRPQPGRSLASDRDLAAFINELNAGGVAYGARLSPRLLVDLLEISGGWIADLVSALDPHAASWIPVSWAGESASENWMDTGREYTERWHHQMQIRDAVGAPLLLQPRWMRPLLDFSVRALPYAYADVAAAPGTTVTLRVDGETSGAWSLVRAAASWLICEGRSGAADATVTLTTDDAWRAFYNALPDGEVAGRARVEGNADLAGPLFRTRSVIV